MKFDRVATQKTIVHTTKITVSVDDPKRFRQFIKENKKEWTGLGQRQPEITNAIAHRVSRGERPEIPGVLYWVDSSTTKMK